MNPKKGQSVQVRFYNGIFFDAIVEEWSDGKSVLLLQDQDTVIIQKTLQDVMMVKILKPKENVQHSEESLPEADKVLQNKESVVSELDSIKSQKSEDRSLQRMAELKDELNKIERKEAFERMNEFKQQGVREVSYGIPRNIQISRSSQHPEQKVASADFALNSELQNLFNKKH